MTLSWLAINDVHLGHPHVSPQLTHENFKLVVYPLLKDIDLLTIGGDFYDSALYLDDVGSIYSADIFADLCEASKQYGFAIRVIRGTYTHDRDQLSQFQQMARRVDVDFEYYTELTVSTIKGYSFLYIPDNLPYPTDGVMSLIKEKLIPFGGKVDCVVGHGYFDYVLPPIAAHGQFISHYKVSAFEKFTNEVVIMGHVHTHSNKGKVWYSGSFDRLCHGEEEDKGCLLIKLDRGNTKVNFIKNAFSMPHVSLTLKGDTIDEQVINVTKQVSKCFSKPLQGYLRLIGRADLKTVHSVIQEKYKGELTVTLLNQDQKEKSTGKTRLNLGFKQHHAEVPTRENLGAFLYQYLNNNVLSFPLSQQDVEQGLDELTGGV